VNENQEHPGWIEISIAIDPVAHEAVSAFLIDLGCEGIVTEDFDDQTLKAYSPFRDDLNIIRDKIKVFLEDIVAIFPEIQAPTMDIKRIKDRDWSTSWRGFFYLDQVTDNLMILPAWEEMPEKADCRIIRIDPGTAFGTGKHPTTRMCLAALEQTRLKVPWNMLDVGTGSGILAVYGVMLGAKRVVAIDIDPEAVRWAKRNIEMIRIPIRIELSTTPIDRLKDSFSVITANLILNTILDLSMFFPRLLVPGGYLILSGLLRDQIPRVENRFMEYGLKKERLTYMEEWACIILKKLRMETS
jgi:ribosomal protein L11 methyltransferase